MKKITIKRISFIAAFSAITVVLYNYVKFNLPIFPSFLDINISMIPVIIATFMLGPIDGCICVVMRMLFKWILPPGTATGYVGEVADLLIGLAVCLSSGLVYHKAKFKGKTVLAFFLVIISWVAMGIISNIFINIPWYTHFYFKGDMTPLIGMCSDAFNLITFGRVTVLNEANFMVLYIFLAVIPFNIMLSAIVALVTLLVHKRLKILYDMI